VKNVSYQFTESSASGSQASISKVTRLKKPITSSKFSPNLLKLQEEKRRKIKAKLYVTLQISDDFNFLKQLTQ